MRTLTEHEKRAALGLKIEEPKIGLILQEAAIFLALVASIAAFMFLGLGSL